MIKKILIFLVPLLMFGCHHKITAPRLWAHDSSAAFEMFIGFYVVNVLLIVCATLNLLTKGK